MDLIERPAGFPGIRHPWETVRAWFFLRVLADAGLPAAGASVLDVGSGDGWFASRLAAASGLQVTCWDAGYAEHSPPADPRLHCTAREPQARFDLVLAMDVAEHVKDDVAFVDSVARRHLGAGAHLLLAVPAWPSLYSEHDRFLRHARRYTPGSARSLLRGAGLRIVRAGGLFHSLLAVRAAQVALERWSLARPGGTSGWDGGPLITSLVRAALSSDARASLLFSRLGWDLPGLSWWALCTMP